MTRPDDTQIQDMVSALRFDAPVYVTRPNLPPLQAYTEHLATIWDRHWLTNDGHLHTRLEAELERFLGVSHLRLFCNGTLALLTALQALELEPGTVITTPFTFPATVNTLYWNRLQPRFCDIDPVTFNINPEGMEALITSDTRAILPVHVYGYPCDVEAIQAVADRHGLPVIYDAAHAFGVRYKNASLLNHGVMSMLSFHATKLFTTAEGGALATNSTRLYERIRLLKNFGIADEERVVAPGINGKMNELQAALGLAQMDGVEEEIAQRARIAQIYREILGNVPGLTLPPIAIQDVHLNHAYYPLRIDSAAFGMNRDHLQTTLKKFNVCCRKYFYPLCSTYPWCQHDSATLPNADAAAASVLCLPIYGALPIPWVKRIGTIISQLQAASC